MTRDLLREFHGLGWEVLQLLGDADIAGLLAAKIDRGENPVANGKKASPKEVFVASWRWRGKTDPVEIEKMWQDYLALIDQQKREIKKRYGRPKPID